MLRNALIILYKYWLNISKRALLNIEIMHHFIYYASYSSTKIYFSSVFFLHKGHLSIYSPPKAFMHSLQMEKWLQF